MKHLFTALAVLVLLASPLLAQHYLPWSTDFDTQGERDEWTQYRLGSTSFYDWGFFTTANAYPYHDYPVGATATDTTLDWLVSPQLFFHSSAKLTLSVNIFTMIGTTPEDRFEVWMSTGSEDPADGDYELIADMTDFGNNGAWSDTSGIVLSDTGTGYIALVYQATQNWFTVGVDSIEVTPDQPLDTSDTSTAVPGLHAASANIRIWPNPATDGIWISTGHGSTPWRYRVVDLHGREVAAETVTGKHTSEYLHLGTFASGPYLVEIVQGRSRHRQLLLVR